MASLATRGRGRIRPPKKGLNTVTDYDYDQNWDTLRRAFWGIFNQKAFELSFETLYRNGYKIVLRQNGAELYQDVTKFVETWLRENVLKQIKEHVTPSLLMGARGAGTVAISSEPRLLKALKQAWEAHQICMGMVTDVLMYMDRVYCTDHRLPPIYVKSMGIFRDEILRAPPTTSQPSLQEVLTRIILDLVAMDRAGERIDHALVKSNIYMLENLYESEQEAEDEKLYLTSFEQYFLDTSADFYREESERLLKDSDAGTYCKHAKARIQEEFDRCRSTLSESTAPKIQRVVEEELIRNHVKTLVEMETGVQYMVDIDQLQQLGDLYDLESSIDQKKTELTRAIRRIISDMGKVINNAAVDAALAPPPAQEEPLKKDEKDKPAAKVNIQTVTALKWVEDVLALKDRFDKILAQSFRADPTLQTAITRSLTEAINAFERGSEYISLFIDENMKKGIRDKSEAEVDSTLEKAIILVRFLQDKDFFESYYKKHLAKRLLLNKSQSMDVEKQMISRMKIELGHSFTTKLEGMFKDMTLSEEYSSGYKSFVSRQGDVDPSRVELNIRMLTSMTWPTEAFRGGASPEEADSRANVIYPSSIERLRHSFERYYAEKHSGRKITWLPNMGDADMKATFPLGGKDGRPRTYDINCSTYSMMILQLFNSVKSGEWLTAEEIQAQTNIPTADLHRNLQSLALTPKTRLLIKEPKSREVSPTDRFAFNEDFTSKFIRFKVNVVAAGNKVENQRERKESEKKNNEHRGFLIEAAIVRIMKQRKESTHSTLLSETIAQLSTHFKPDVNMIKKKIESLIERDYLERVEEAAMPSYRYLA